MDFHNLSKLYQAAIMEYSTSPTYHYKIENPTHSYEIYNPSCGDLLFLQLVIQKEQIVEIAYLGEGCAISMASAYLMCQSLKGKTLDQAMKMDDLFRRLMTKNISNEEKKLLGEVVVLEGVANFPMRIRCGTLPWEAFDEIVGREESTEGT